MKFPQILFKIFLYRYIIFKIFLILLVNYPKYHQIFSNFVQLFSTISYNFLMLSTFAQVHLLHIAKKKTSERFDSAPRPPNTPMCRPMHSLIRWTGRIQGRCPYFSIRNIRTELHSTGQRLLQPQISLHLPILAYRNGKTQQHSVSVEWNRCDKTWRQDIVGFSSSKWKPSFSGYKKNRHSWEQPTPLLGGCEVFGGGRSIKS